MIRKFLVHSSICLVLAASAGSVCAQTLQSEQQPDVQRIVAVVNDKVISAYDLNLRMALVVAATGGVTSEDQYLQLRDQVLQSMVDELLQIQEAGNFKIDITQAEIDDAINNLAKNNNMTHEQFARYLASIGSDIDSLTLQIKSGLAWQQLIQGKFGAQTKVSDAEVDAVIDRMKASAGEFEFHVGEIFLTDESTAGRGSAQGLAQQLAQQLQGNASFENLARQFSRSTTAALGGDIGWVQANQLPTPVAAALSKLQVGGVSPPIAADGGYYILQLKDQRRILAADPLDVQLDLKQISIDVSPDSTAEETKALVDHATQVAAGRDACADTAGVARDLGTSSFGDLGKVTVRDLPADLRDAVKDLSVGQSSHPVLRDNQMQVLVVCDRVEPKVQPPSPDAIENSLTNQRLAMMSRRYLRDLRQDAIIDYR